MVGVLIASSKYLKFAIESQPQVSVALWTFPFNEIFGLPSLNKFMRHIATPNVACEEKYWQPNGIRFMSDLLMAD